MPIFLATADKVTFGREGGVPRRGDAPARIVIHTTEGRSIPNYEEGKSAPHFTIGVGHPESLPREAPGVVRLQQHNSLDRTARSLRRGNGFETNHMGRHCIQIETVTCVGDNPKANIKGNNGKLPDALFEALAGLVREIVAALPASTFNLGEFPADWVGPSGSGTTAKQRMTPKQWERFNGICGHQHVPNNSHWDPGQFDIKRLVKALGQSSEGSGATQGTKATAGGTPEWPMLLVEGDRHAKVAIVRGLLQTFGIGEFAPGDLYNANVVAAVKELQKQEKIDVDGDWGPQTHAHAQLRLDRELKRV